MCRQCKTLSERAPNPLLDDFYPAFPFETPQATPSKKEEIYRYGNALRPSFHPAAQWEAEGSEA
jgi:hypothetical protein